MNSPWGCGLFRHTSLAMALGVTCLVRPVAAQLTFDSPLRYPANDAYVVTFLHFDGDQALDLAVLQDGEGTFDDSLLVFLNDRAGSFVAGPAFPCSAGVGRIAAADLDHEGQDDLVVTCVYGDVMVFLNKPSGIMVTTYQVLSNPGYVDVVDIDHDSDMDLAIAINGSNGIQLLTNSGNGQFTFGQRLTGIGVIGQIDSADFNEDGHVDIVVGVENSSRLNILYGDGAGNFTRTWFSWNPQFAVASADFDDDGHADIAARDGSLRFFWGDGQGGFSGPTSVSTFGAGLLTVDDWNRDGLPDLAVSSYLNQSYQTFVENLGARGFSAQPYDLGGFGTARLASGDVDGDGWPDLAGGSKSASIVSVLRNANAPATGVERSPPAVRLTIAPNPAQRRFTAAFDLSGAATATLELWDVQGRRLDRRDVGSFGPGRHQIAFGNSRRLAPGIYLVRLIQGDRVTTARACLIE